MWLLQETTLIFVSNHYMLSEVMKYLPAAVAAAGVALTVILALYLLQNGYCLWGLIFMIIPYGMLPDEATEKDGSKFSHQKIWKLVTEI
jgi:hypothetical protein